MASVPGHLVDWLSPSWLSNGSLSFQPKFANRRSCDGAQAPASIRSACEQKNCTSGKRIWRLLALAGQVPLPFFCMQLASCNKALQRTRSTFGNGRNTSPGHRRPEHLVSFLRRNWSIDPAVCLPNLQAGAYMSLQAIRKHVETPYPSN